VRHSKGTKWLEPQHFGQNIRKLETPADTPPGPEESEIQKVEPSDAMPDGPEASEIQAALVTPAPQLVPLSPPTRVLGPVLGEPSNPLERLWALFGGLDAGDFHFEEVLRELTSQLPEDSAGLLSLVSNLREAWQH